MKGSKAIGSMLKLLKVKELSLKTKLRIHTTVVRTTVMY